MKLRTKFQDEDFASGEIVDADVATMPDGRIKLQAVAKAGGLHTIFYDKLEKLYVDWEDAPEEPKEYWYINEYGSVIKAENFGRETLYDKSRKNFGNYFETEEEAELAVRKLEAWKRLEEAGFRFEYIEGTTDLPPAHYRIIAKIPRGMMDYAEFLFGGEE